MYCCKRVYSFFPVIAQPQIISKLKLSSTKIELCYSETEVQNKGLQNP